MSIRLLEAIKNGSSLQEIEQILLQDQEVRINEDYHFAAGIPELEVSGIALHVAIAQRKPALVRLLLTHQADPDRVDAADRSGFDILLSFDTFKDFNNERARNTISIMDALFEQGATFPTEALKQLRFLVQEQHAILYSMRALPRPLTEAQSLALEAKEEVNNIKKHVLKKMYRHLVYMHFIRFVSRNDLASVNKCLSQTAISLVHEYYPQEILCSASVDFQKDPSGGGHYGLAVLEAARLSSPQMLAFLKQKNFYFEVQDHRSNNILHYAAASGSLSVLEWLFREEPELARSLLNQRNKKGDTALHLAYMKQHQTVIDFLVGKGAFHLMNFEGERPGETLPTLLWLAAQNLASRPTEIARILADVASRRTLLPEESSLFLYVAMEQVLPHLSHEPANTADLAAQHPESAHVQTQPGADLAEERRT